jgi:UDP-glucose 4-epimerase
MNPNIAVVTGGAGFIGSHMVDLLLARDYRVRVIDNLAGGREANLARHSNESRLSFEQLDIRRLSPGEQSFQGVDLVFHFAGIGDIVPSIERPSEYMDVNVQGTVKILECARAANAKKFVYAASSSCYGLAAVPTCEAHPIAPQHPYALSKYLGEQAVLHWHNVYRLPANSIRIFNAYGPRVRTTGAYGAVFGVFFKQKLAGKPFTVIGDGLQRRDFVFVTDVAEAFLRAGESRFAGHVWNLGAGNPQTVNRLVELLGGPVVHIPKRPGEPDCTWAAVDKIQSELGWKPIVAFEQGVRRMMEDIELWRDAPLWEPQSIARASELWFRYLGRTAQ